LSLLRCPSGTNEQCFFAKHPFAGLSKAVRQVDVGEAEPMLALDGLEGLLNLVQAGVVEIHPWGSRTDDLDRPDRLIFDLDPGEGAPWDAVIAAAGEVRDRLHAKGLRSFVKTTGGKGLHVVVPIEPSADWATAKSFTASIAEAMAGDHPDRYVATVAKRARRGRIYIDFLRNDRGSTAVAAYSTRSLCRPPCRRRSFGTNCRAACARTTSPWATCATGWRSSRAIRRRGSSARASGFPAPYDSWCWRAFPIFNIGDLD
jgi:bifunctional non-homologous end joining protein LigD